jgi:hypothetical protein
MESMNIPIISECDETISSYSGYCSSCSRIHVFSGTDCHPLALELMELLFNKEYVAPHSGSFSNQHTLSTDSLFGESRGKMFGVMECLATDGQTIHVKAFSGQFKGYWLVEGWAPPLFDVDAWIRLNTKTEPVIKNLGKDSMVCSDDPIRKKRLLQERKVLSQDLMKELHGLYRLTNFRGQTVSLSDLIHGKTGVPTGTGDCCAPKLLNFAATHNLIPIGISEFFWGRENKSGNRRHRHFYPPCTEKCGLILGFLLCGLEELYVQQGL